ncbi:MAG: NAD(P)/FAD-dependent oxidoreductase [Actinomycetota bacterium]|nr:MAG: NAD(P)/FAD-dependent oxidoreductase [Actinomycetota bacterium]
MVVVGNGMAGSRVVEELRRRDPARMLGVTIVGAERAPAYNRILLTEVLAGRHSGEELGLVPGGWHDDHGVDLVTGDPVDTLDRAARKVVTASGRVLPYDVLVLATGADAALPDIEGLRTEAGQLLPNAFALRTLDDLRELQRARRHATRAVVLGGGLLGLEVGRGLVASGLETVVVHVGPHLLDRQLDSTAGNVLVRAAAGVGLASRIGRAVTRIVRNADGAVGGVELDDGTCVLADLLVLATGARPQVGLARAAGLRVERGIVVDDTLRSVDDPRVFALGDCAEHDGVVAGLVAPAWEQAAVIAAQLTGADPAARYRGSRVAARLKADGLHVAAMGARDAELPGDDVVVVADTAQGTYRKLVVRDGRIAGATVVGELSTVGVLTQLFTRQARLPGDRVSLLAPGSGTTSTPAASPSLMPAGTTVCSCNGVTKGAIQQAVLGGSRSVAAVARATRATTGCGGCRDVVSGIVDWLAAADPQVEVNA